MKHNNRGLFIVLEGLDKCGKSTQTQMISEKLDAEKMQFPDRSSSMGSLISDYLRGQKDMSDQVIHLLFSANRWEQKNKIIDALQSGKNIICDRYAYSGVAFSSAKGLEFDWCKQCDQGLPKPDIVIYLKAPIGSIKNRGDFGAERYEKQEFQAKVSKYFDRLAQEEQFYIIDALQSIEEVNNQITQIIENYQNQNRDLGLIQDLWIDTQIDS